MPAPTIRVPIETPMFDEDGNLTRTWILFFERCYQGPPATTAAAGPWARTLLLKDTKIANDVADHVPVFVAGKAVRLIGLLRNAISSDLTVRCNINGAALVSLTIPYSTFPDAIVIATTFTPADLPDLGVLTWDVVESDESVDPNGVASFTLQWA